MLPYTGPAKTNAVVSHKYRKALIRWVNRWRDLRDCVWRLYEEDPKYPHSQHLYVAEGDRLLAVKTNGGTLLNGAFVNVLKLDDENITVEDDMTGQITALPHSRFQEHLVSSVAVTYQGLQAKSVPGTVALHQTGHKHFSRRHLLVGMSRATHISNLSIK